MKLKEKQQDEKTTLSIAIDNPCVKKCKNFWSFDS